MIKLEFTYSLIPLSCVSEDLLTLPPRAQPRMTNILELRIKRKKRHPCLSPIDLYQNYEINPVYNMALYVVPLITVLGPFPLILSL